MVGAAQPRLAAACSLRPREAVAAAGTGWLGSSCHAATSTTLQRPYQPSTTSPCWPPEVVPHLQPEQEPGQGDLLPLLALDVGQECAYHLRHLWSIVGKPGCWRMLGPEPLNSCSGNTWATRMPGTTSCTHQRLLSALDIPNNHNLTSPHSQTPKAPKRKNPVLDYRRQPELATTFPSVGRSCPELLQVATLLLMNSNSSSFSSTSQLLISLPLRVS